MQEAQFQSAQDVFDWMEGFVNLERSRVARGLRLDRMERLCALAGNPERVLPSVHIAGSKGKGSVATMIASIAEEAGLKPGLYLSPHVSDYRERVSMARGFFPEEVYCSQGERLRDLTSLYRTQYGDEEEARPSFFELATLYFFLCSVAGGCGSMVVETGMGGRLDATNILMPELSVIQPIELEHTEWLGPTVEAIAAEKAGIIKPHRPVVVSAQGAGAFEVLRKAAEERESPLYPMASISDVQIPEIQMNGTSFLIDYPGFPGGNPFGRALEGRMSVVGEIQAKNAAVAAISAAMAFPEVNAKVALQGLEKVVLPARFERVMADPSIVLDGAHTIASVRLLCDTFTHLYGRGGILVFGTAIDKDVHGMAQILAPLFSKVFVTRPGTFKKSDPVEAHRAFQGIGCAEAILIQDTQEALAEAAKVARSMGLPVLVTGSFFLAAEARVFYV